ncbi:MAG TPA: diguanylate cyclase [Catenuloplanes sp.]
MTTINATAVDSVTGVLPREHLQPHLRTELSRAADRGGTCSLFLFDVDFFKTVNDVYGHQRGDAALRQIADRVKAAVRGSDTLFRYGGDEFVVLLPDTDRQEALQLALRLTTHVRETAFAGEPPLHLSISLGVASYPDDAQDDVALLRCADRRNYLAKHRGRGGAVADDADTSTAGGSSRLWERDAALAATHDFLSHLAAHQRGAFQVTGPGGAGHSRFLEEVQRLAGLRGFTVVPVTAAAAPTVPVLAAPVLLVADVDAVSRVDTTVAQWATDGTTPQVLGVVYATNSIAVAPPGALPAHGVVELTPWSPATQRIWLRSALQGEPSRALVSWIARESGGLPAAAARELARLRTRHALVPDGAGGWTLSPSVLGRPRRQVRLPAPVTGLVGREQERGRVVELLRDARLVTLLGPGGIGKTRLSLSVAGALADEFDDGAVFVALADTTTTDQVVQALARALRIDEVPGQPILDGITDHLADSSLLLVLDNLEQVLGAAPVLGHLLAAAPDVTVLATSREPLAVYGEQVYRVPPLPSPDLAALPPGPAGVVQALAQSPAVALFDQRARAADPDFQLDQRSLAAVAQLCRRLDGLPLAIELAAARTDRLSPAELLSHLDQHLATLGDGPRDRPERQQTLRGAIDWSFALLDPDEQRLFETLAVFTGGCVADAALAVAGDPDGDPDSDPGRPKLKELAGRLAALADKSLLTVATDPDGQLRYGMLETIRAYAEARLVGAGAAPVHARHCAHYAALSDAAAAGMAGPEQAGWAERLDREYANLRTAVSWAFEYADPDAAGRICLGLWRYWRNGSHIGEGRRWLDRLLGGDVALAAGRRALLLYPAAVLAATQDDDESAASLGRQCLAAAESVGDRQTTAQARNILGVAALRAGRYDEASDHFGYGLVVWRELDQPQGTAIALGNLAKLCLRLGQVDDAAEHIQQCLALERATGNARGVLLGLECLTEILLAQGNPAAAREVGREGLALSRDLGDVFGEAMALHQLGLAARAAGDRAEALELFLAALDRRHEVGDREDLAVSLDCVAEVVVNDDAERAVRLLAAAEGLRQAQRLVEPPDVDGSRAATLASARLALGTRPFAAAWRAGKAASLEQMVDEALDGAAPAVARAA